MRTMVASCVMAMSVLMGACSSGQDTQAAPRPDRPAATTLVFNERGEAALPRGYRSWVHTYSAWEPLATSLLDEKPTTTPEFHNVYVEPTAYRAYMKTGRWPEGT